MPGTASRSDQLPGQVDLLVVGAGAGGMTAALTASVLGLDVLVIEKSAQVGGTAARSAGSVWIPGTRHATPDRDSFQNALTYLRNAIGNDFDDDRVRAFLRAGPEMVAFLEKHTPVVLRAYPHHPDYQATLEGATLNGRALEPLPFDAAVLGGHFRDLRPPLPEFTLLGGMMVDRNDISHLMAATRRLASFEHTTRLLARYLWDRMRYHRGARLVMGNALAGRLYYGLLRRQVRISTSTQVEELILAGGAVTGARLRHHDRTVTVQARAGVVLATGGLSNDPELRRRLFPQSISSASPVVDSATADGFRLAQKAGGRLQQHAINGFWTPVSRRRRADGSVAAFPHFVLDRGKPGMLAVDPSGQRFVNEATSYHLFGEALFATLARHPGGTCHLVCDDAFIASYGAGMVRPRRIGLRAAMRDGYLLSDGSLEGLAAKIGVSPATLAATVARHNRFADTGVDIDFGKGEDAYQRNLGDPTHRPNPCIGSIAQPPFYALAIHPGDIGASAGLACDAEARVLDADAQPIHGLYACGNDMASIMAASYPGPGITLGPAMTFGYLAARHAHAALGMAGPSGD